MIQQFSRLSLSSQEYLFSQIGDSQIPSQFHDSSNISKLDSLIIQNFKSFDKKYVGPFLNFTSIIGPNGSGKSNILDAIMFCFCSENSKNLLIDARELINRQGKQSFKELAKMGKTCYVQATFILKNGQKFIINRTLQPEGKEQYYVNLKNVNKKIYQNILLRKGINCNSPNYAIWQGQIDRLILKDPQQLTTLIQNISGSIYYKKAYEQTKQKLSVTQIAIQQKTRKINKIKGERKNLKAVKQTSQQYNKYQSRYQQVIKKIFYLQILQKQRRLRQLEDQVEKVADQQRKKISQLNQMKSNAQRDYTKRSQLQNQLNQIMNKMAINYSILKNIGNPANVLKEHKLKQLESEHLKKINQIQSFQYRRKIIQENMPEIPPSELVQEYLDLYQQWQQQNSALHKQINKKRNELLYVQGIMQAKATLMQQFQNKKQKSKQKKHQKAKTIKELQADLSSLTQSIRIMQSQSSKLNQQSEKVKVQYQKKNQTFLQLCLSIADIQNLIVQQAQDEKEGQMLKNLASIDGFYGTLYQKIKPTSSKYDVCFFQIFSTSGKYLLCQSQQCSRKISNRLKQIRLMKNVIILDNLKQKKANDIRKTLGKDGVMGIDIVDFDEGTTKLKDYLIEFLHGKVVCQNIQAAYRIRNKNIQGVRQIYTIDGNIIRRDGTVSSHGNPESIKKTHKYLNNKNSIYQQLSKLNKQKIKIQSQIRDLKLKHDQNSQAKRNSQIDQMHKKKQMVSSKIKQLKTDKQEQLVLPQSVLQQIKQLQNNEQKIKNSLFNLEKGMKSSKIFQQFMKIHKIDNLQAFRNANNLEYLQKLMKKKNQNVKQISLIEANLQKLKKQANRIQKQKMLIEEEIRNIPQIRDRSKIQDIISQQQKQIGEIRNKLTKLSTINRNQLTFQPQLPALEAKLVYTKQKIAKDLEDFAYQLGAQFRYPVPHQEITKQLNLPRKVTDKTLQSLYEKFQQEKLKIQQQLDKHNSINLLMNIEEDQQKLQKGMNNLIDQIEQAIKDRKRFNEQLQAIRKDRASLFINFVNLLKQHLHQSYSLLTQQEDGSKGTANLHLQSMEQPFEHGVYFTPTPPTKRFVYDLQQLSGGERSIASLALQYSISLASKSPLLLLDETDAFLDIGNVNRFLKLINNSLKNHKIQLIIITHKQGLFSKSQSLVGVSRPKSLNVSQVYSLDLTNH